LAVSIHIDMKADQASSNGKVEMRDGNYIMLGDAVYYDVETKRAQWTAAPPLREGYSTAARYARWGDKTYDIDNG
jgi:hypothetical protein